MPEIVPGGTKGGCPEKPASMGLGDKKACFVPVPADICYPYLFSYPLNNRGKWGQNKGFVPEAHGYWLRRLPFCPLICPLIPVLSPNGSTSGFRPGTNLSPHSCFVPKACGCWLWKSSFCPLIPVLSPNGSTSGFWPGTDLSPSCHFGDKKHLMLGECIGRERICPPHPYLGETAQRMIDG